MDERREENAETTLERLKDQSLKAAGYAYLVGDAALFASGAMAGRYKEAASGLLWGVGGAVCAKYGNPNAEAEARLLSHRLGEYLRRQNIVIPDAPDLAELTKPRGVIDQAEAFLYRYPSQILNAVYATGAVQLVRSGMQHGKHWDTASGALIAAGALSGLLIPERARDEDNPPKSALHRCVQWVQEKPLRVSGALFALNNVTLTMSALKEMRTNPAQKSYLFKFLTAGSYIFGNTMLALTSKNHAGDGKVAHEALRMLEERAAQVIASQPPPLREALLTQVAVFLSAQPEVHRTTDELTGDLHARLDALTRPVAKLANGVPSWQQRVAPLDATPTLSL